MEYGIKVKDADIGDVVATRLANERDELGNIRYIQLVDIASREAALEKIRGVSSQVSSVDTKSLPGMPDELTENMLAAGDKAALIICPAHSQDNGSVDITPIVSMVKNGGGAFEIVFDGRYEYGADYSDDNFDVGTWSEYTSSDASMGENIHSGTGNQLTFVQLLGFYGVDAGRKQTIGSASIDIYLEESYGDGHAPNIVIYAFSQKEVDTIYSENTDPADRANALMALSATKTGVGWDLSGGANNSWETSPDIASIVQPIIDSDGWTRDGNVWLYFQPEPVHSMLGMTLFNMTNSLYYPRVDIAHAGGVQDLTVLETKRSAVGSTAQFQDSDSKYRSPMLSWDLKGAFKVGAHITALSDSNGVVIYGGVI